MELPYNLQITGAVNGFIVHARCKTFVFNGPKNLLAELEHYFDDPGKCVKQWTELYPELLNETIQDRPHPQMGGVISGGPMQDLDSGR